ncbi:MAG: hypothetical protein LBQ62_01530 [Candidatus Accumulibacter sp.]|jgi:hypothetical protein|nr:hypothetical protein [Accumulibacter sp.]
MKTDGCEQYPGRYHDLSKTIIYRSARGVIFPQNRSRRATRLDTSLFFNGNFSPHGVAVKSGTHIAKTRGRPGVFVSGRRGTRLAARRIRVKKHV